MGKEFLTQIMARAGIQIPAGAGAGKVLQSDASGNVSWASSPAAPALVSTLPGSPSDGDEIFFQSTAMATDGVVWRLRYRSAASGSYKWEFVGRAPLQASASTDELLAAATTTYATLTTGVSFAIPLAGDYLIYNASTMYPWATGQVLYVAADGAGLTAADADAGQATLAAIIQGFGAYEVRKTLTTGTLTQKYRHSNSGADANFRARVMRAIPIRLG